MTHLGIIDLDAGPAVVLALRDGVPRETIDAAIASGADAVELRIDEFRDTAVEAVADECRRLAGIPLLATVRAAAEGGKWRGTEQERLGLYRAVLPLVDAVDIELSAKEIRGEVIEAAHSSGKTVLGSFHDFDATPSDAVLAALAEDAREAGADILKVAARCNNAAELRRLTRFTIDHAEAGCAVIGMGPLGMSTRIFFPMLGSLLTYTFLGEPTAPGQLNCEDTLRYLSVFRTGQG